MNENLFSELQETGSERIVRERKLAGQSYREKLHMFLLFLGICLGMGIGAASSILMPGGTAAHACFLLAIGFGGGLLGAVFGVAFWIRMQIAHDAMPAGDSRLLRNWWIWDVDFALAKIFWREFDYVFTIFLFLTGCGIVHEFGERSVVTAAAAFGGLLPLGIGFFLKRRYRVAKRQIVEAIVQQRQQQGTN